MGKAGKGRQNSTNLCQERFLQEFLQKDVELKLLCQLHLARRKSGICWSWRPRVAQVSLKSWGKPQIHLFASLPPAGKGYFWNNGVIYNHVSPSRIFLEGFLCLPGIPAGRRGLQKDEGCVPTIHYKWEKGNEGREWKRSLVRGHQARLGSLWPFLWLPDCIPTGFVSFHPQVAK